MKATASPARPAGDTAPGRRELLLAILRESDGPRSFASLADELGVHVNTVRFHVDALSRSGQVEQLAGARDGPGRPPLLVQATRRMDPGGPTNYRLLASVLTSHLADTGPDPSGTAEGLGRAWGPRLVGQVAPPYPGRTSRGTALRELSRVMHDLGFAPEPPIGPRDTTIRLRHCPFLGLATRDTDTISGTDSARTDPADGCPAVICSLHLGMMQGALERLRGPITVDRLDAFVEPDLCVAHLAPLHPKADRTGDRDG